MIEYFLTVAQQIFAMALMVVIGYIAYRKGMISDKGLNDMSQLLLKFVTFMVIFSSYQREFSLELFKEWVLMFGISALTYLVAILVATLIYRKKENPCLAESRLALAFSNSGFIGFPLLTALLGEKGVFLGSTNVVILNILLWTYGTKSFFPKEKLKMRQVFLNPGSLAVMAGILLFISPWKLPAPIFQATSTIGSMNTPLAMVVFGCLLVQADIKAFFKNFELYKISFIKLLVIPIIVFGILAVLPLSTDIKIVGALCVATPTATALPIISELYKKNVAFASGVTLLCTIISALTIPVMMAVAKVILGF